MSAATRSTSATGRPRRCGRPGLARRLALGAGLVAAAAVPATARADGAAATGATAQNVSITIQLLWQVQQGCAIRCVDTSQTQVAAQRATTLQVAAATAPGDGGAAVATNTSATIQLIVQNQLGCVAFCLRTTRLQAADQRADATQLASAIATALSQTGNAAHVTQLVWQYQDACLESCVDVQADQVVAQAAAAIQAAGGSADASAAPGVPAASEPPLPPELASFTVWLATVAASATVDVVQERDVADCLADCAGDVQLQISIQETSTTQVSVADPDIPAASATASLSVPPAPGEDGAPAAAAASAAPARTAPASAARTRAGVAHRPRRRAARRCARARRALPEPHQRRTMIGGIHCGT